MELPRITLLRIKLQKTPPQGSIQLNNGAKSTFETTVTVGITAIDILSGINQQDSVLTLYGHNFLGNLIMVRLVGVNYRKR